MKGTLAAHWLRMTARSPRAIAVIDGADDTQWTRSALTATALEWSRSQGASAWSGNRVALSLPNGAEWFRVFLGLSLAGAIPVPLDPSEPEESLQTAAAGVGAIGIWRCGRFHEVAVATGKAPRTRRYEALVKMTSGSSGSPKGLAVSHNEALADGWQVCRTMGIQHADRNLAVIPLGYSYGLGNVVIPLIFQGTSVVCVPTPLPHAIGAHAAKYHPTVFPAVPPILKALVASEVLPRSLSTLRLVISAGSPLPSEVGRAYLRKFGTRIHGFYGTSETGGIAYDRSGEPTLTGRSVGKPLRRVRIAVSRSGRLTVSSPAVVGRRSFSPADRVSISPRDELVLLGRTDRVVKIAGRRVDLAEIESALRILPGVSDAFVHAEPGGDPAAAVVCSLEPADLRRRLRLRLASWKVPGRFVVMDRFPTTARGKPDAQRLRHMLSEPRTATSISTLSADLQMSAPR